MLRILVTGAGGAAAVSFLKAISGDDVVIFAGDADPLAAGLYLVPRAQRVVVPMGNAPGYAQRVLSWCTDHRIDIVVPTVDAELIALADARDEFEMRSIRLVLAPATALRTCLDKWALYQATTGVVRRPRTAVYDRHFDAASWQYPVVIKPRVGSGGRGVRVLGNVEALLAIPRSPDLLVQEWLPGDEYSVDVLSNLEGRVLSAVPRQRLRVDSGVCVVARVVRDHELIAAAAQVASALGLTYACNVQFRRDRAGRISLLEINPRFPGSMPITVAAGVNMPRLSIQLALGCLVADQMFSFRELAVARFLSEKFVAGDELDAMMRSPAVVSGASVLGAAC